MGERQASLSKASRQPPKRIPAQGSVGFSILISRILLRFLIA
jgi:hypothetical protein